jgi:hypothetical protein
MPVPRRTVRGAVLAFGLASVVSACSSGQSTQLDSTPAPAAPTSASGPSISGAPVQTQTLTADPGVWSGTQPIRFGYQWQRCGVDGGRCTAADGESERTYVLGAVDVGRTIRVTVAATNSVGAGSATSPHTTVVASSTGPPVAVSEPAVAGTVARGQKLTVSPGIWVGSKPMTFSYQWLPCDVGGGSCRAPTGANASTFVPGRADTGRTIRVRVTVTNSLGSTTATSPPTGLVP